MIDDIGFLILDKSHFTNHKSQITNQQSKI